MFEQAKEIMKFAENIPAKPQFTGDYWSDIKMTVQNFKAAFLVLADMAVEKFDKKLPYEQEIIFNFADMITQAYVAESFYLRVKKMESIKGEAIGLYKDMLNCFLFDASTVIYKNGLEAILSMDCAEKRDMQIAALRCFTTVVPTNVKDARRRIADKLIEENKYCF